MNTTNNGTQNGLSASESKHPARKAMNSHPQSAWLAPLAVVLMLAFGHGAANAALVVQVGTNLCVTVEGAYTTNETPVVAYHCEGTFDQQWNYVLGQLQGIGTTGAVNMCLNVKGNPPAAAGTYVDLYTCSTSDDNQQWYIVTGRAVALPATDTLIYNWASGLCLDSAGPAATGGGTQLIVNTCTGAASQLWRVL
jgi:hypothetical protein